MKVIFENSGGAGGVVVIVVVMVQWDKHSDLHTLSDEI